MTHLPRYIINIKHVPIYLKELNSYEIDFLSTKN